VARSGVVVVDGDDPPPSGGGRGRAVGQEVEHGRRIGRQRPVVASHQSVKSRQSAV
jgi:hypothetical protein